MKNVIDLCRTATIIYPNYDGMAGLLTVLCCFLLVNRTLDLRHMNRFREAGTLQDPEQHPGGIKFVPRHPMAHRGRACMVIIVPTLPEGEKSNPRIGL